DKVLLKLNAPTDKLDAIVGVLPSLHAPTINRLHGENWVAVETVINRLQTRELIPQLKAAGAEGILELSLTKLVG
ncbi:MAG: ATP phosphoribosyltransferase, partial [Desulfobacterales bacterium]|nr:ATP phosphoribosyltransferase [Desulfobacterales bacterium]